MVALLGLAPIPEKLQSDVIPVVRLLPELADTATDAS